MSGQSSKAGKMSTTLEENALRILADSIDIRPNATLGEVVSVLGANHIRLASVWLTGAKREADVAAYLEVLQRSEEPVAEAFTLAMHRVNARQKGLLSAAAVFSPDCDFTTDALLMVWGGEIPHISVRHGILEDLDKLTPYFLESTPNGYRIPEAIEELALDILSPAAALHHRHLAYYKKRSENWLHTRDEETVEETLRAEIEQYQQAVDWAAAYAHDDLIALVIIGGQFLWQIPAYQSVVRGWLDTVLRVAAIYGDDWGQAGQMRVLGDVSVRVRHFDTAREYYYRALMLYDGIKSMAGQAHTFKGLGDLSLAEVDLEVAQSYYYKALLMYEEVKFELGLANTLYELASLSLRRGDTKTAEDYFRQAAEGYERIDFQMGQAHALKALGELRMRDDDPAAAEKLYRSALRLYEEIAFWSDQAHTWIALGDLAMEANNTGEARHAYDSALDLMEKAGDRPGMATALRALGNFSLEDGRLSASLAFYREARDLYMRTGSRLEAAVLNQIMAHLRLDQGYEMEAVKLMREAVNILNEIGAPAHAHEARGRMLHLMENIGAGFDKLWAEVTGGEALPRWLLPEDEQSIPPDLLDYLGGVVLLYEGLHHDDSALLYQVAALPYQLRTVWLEQALAAFEDALKADVHPISVDKLYLSQAILYKELASVPGQSVSERLNKALQTYNLALEHQKTMPLEYARTQNKRVALLRDMAGLPGEDRPARLYQALEGCGAALENQKPDPIAYAGTQLHRANLLRELAGLRSERPQRPARMYEALAAYDEVLQLLPESTLEYATAQINRASLLQEVGSLPNEDRANRLREALQASANGLELAKQHGEDALPLCRSAEQLMGNIRESVLNLRNISTFNMWWDEIVGDPQPNWDTA